MSFRYTHHSPQIVSLMETGNSYRLSTPIGQYFTRKMLEHAAKKHASDISLAGMYNTYQQRLF